MNDTINRQAAIDAIMGEYPDAHYPDWYASKIMALPPAQTERPKGKWMPHIEKTREYIGAVLVNVRYDYWLCDTCGYRVENGQPTYNFCPHCGVDMRGEQDG